MIVIAMSLAAFSQADAKSNEQMPPPPSFTLIDANADGEIDFDEFFLQELPHGDHQTVFSEIDTDSNGVISEQEFADHKPPHPPKR